MAGQRPHCCFFLLFVVASTTLTVGGIFCSILIRPLLISLYVKPIECQHPALPANHTGLKAMIGTIGKGGTRTMGQVLNDIGLKAYHSEEVYAHVLRQWDRRMKQLLPENWDYFPSNWAKYLIEGLDPRANEELAAAISRCRVDAMAFDGLETTFWPVYDMSPDVKVLYLRWRSYKQWRASLDKYMWTQTAMSLVSIIGFSAALYVPWGLIVHLLEPLLGRPIARKLAGGETLSVQGPLWFFYFSQGQGLLQLPGLLKYSNNMTIAYLPKLEEDYERVMNYIPERVPPKRFKHVDPRTTTYEELCEFLEVSPCPMKGKFPKAFSSFAWERDYCIQGTVCMAIRGFLHWVNWRLFLGALACCRRRRKAKEG